MSLFNRTPFQTDFNTYGGRNSYHFLNEIEAALADHLINNKLNKYYDQIIILMHT